ncbi:terpene synthase family protein [Kitasatospora sp. NBC_01300]|uniref:terpene synthase family protein n=1 Tax=Kitasatospora sp. NBC_01300 TaxID=2903574 RepID=UPI00352D3B4C|nr:terpene synthase family protein [Kitasatospora sp. NBC_01300]
MGISPYRGMCGLAAEHPGGPDLLAGVARPAPHGEADALRRDVGAWLVASGALGGDVQGFLAQGHLDLVAEAWGDVPRGPRLVAAAKWLVLTWILDDRFDDQWIGGPVTAARRTVRALTDVLDAGLEGVRGGVPDGDALVEAFAVLWRDTVELTPPQWQARYAAYFRAYLDTSLGYLDEAALRDTPLSDSSSHGTPFRDTPFHAPGAAAPAGAVQTVPEYLRRRDQDGAVSCAAGWIELAHGLDLADEVFRHPRVADLLMRFNHVVCWVNDLYSAEGESAAGNGKNLLRSFTVHEGLAPKEASARLGALCEAESTTLEFLADGIARDPSAPGEVRAFALGLVRFTRALIHWTATAARYRTESPR